MNRNSKFSLILGALLMMGWVTLAAFTVLPTPNTRSNQVRLVFKEGMLNHLSITEVLKITMHFPQVDNDDITPSTRTTNYDFTESVEKVNPDGSALIAMTLDSFKTKIVLSHGKEREEFFAFNSNNDEDLQKKFRDIRTMPRAQFLGQSIRFNVATDGQVTGFQNLDQFHQAVIGKDYDYDFVHAMLSLSDSMRLAQLFEQGFGAVGAAASTDGKTLVGKSTATEIPVRRSITVIANRVVADGDSIAIRMVLTDAPAHIDYLEGLAANLGLSDYHGAGGGYAIVRNGMVVRAAFRDSSYMNLHIDVDTVPDEIVRTVTSSRTSISVLRGGVIHFEQKGEHRAKPVESGPDTNSIMIDANTGKITRPSQTETNQTGPSGPEPTQHDQH